MTDTQWAVLDQAYQALRGTVAKIPAEGWQLPTPCEQWDVTQVLQHSAGDQIAYTAKRTGGAGPSYDPFAPSGTLEGTPSELLEPALAGASAAFADVDPSASEVAVPLPPFTLPAEQAVGAAALDAAIHAWDIAVATGQPSPLTPALVQTLRPVAEALAEPLRGFAYGSAIEPAAGANEEASLLNYLGRRAD